LLVFAAAAHRRDTRSDLDAHTLRPENTRPAPR
jgi:hypothetical protein